MPFIATNCILVLVPAALNRGWRRAAGQFDAIFYVVQLVELAAGTAYITPLGFNMRDRISKVRG